MYYEELTKQIRAAAAPMAVYVTGSGVSRAWGVAAGFADVKTEQSLTTDTPFRSASNTKTFVAAAILRLWEEGRLRLDTPVSAYITPDYSQILRAAGYNPDLITVRHLLSHSSGLYDHADEAFIEEIIRQPQRVWTREEQIRRSVTSGKAARAAGKLFSYSDTGYILLGDIIERVTGNTLASATRQLLFFDRLGLSSVWWEGAEVQPKAVQPRARQYLGRTDGTDFHATMDNFGGGGLVMSVRDLADWTAHLFENRIFQNSATLNEMKTTETHQLAESYRLGLMFHTIGAFDVYRHLGFWGSAAYYCPALKLSVAGFTTNRENRAVLIAVIERLIALRSDE